MQNRLICFTKLFFKLQDFSFCQNHLYFISYTSHVIYTYTSFYSLCLTK